ncbi:MAG: indole-3-glycerol phosphate synthase TrpC [Armatimonadota bacterium]|nr:indole-3-glycerol phosphate synthase TrpC [Armatimonadota bacterium]MDR5696614.1 indole-3-glycerol phosphate synthase TrpC [Armatimonadota bacterium]
MTARRRHGAQTAPRGFWVLEAIVAHKRQELRRAAADVPEAIVRTRALQAPAPRDFAAALRTGSVAVIGEIKAASPSAGVLRAGADPVALARAYEEGGAQAISVLTDGRFFDGAPEHLMQVRRAVSLPVLRKDFTLAPYHVYEARALGADAVLLIAAILDDGSLLRLRQLAESLGMAAIVEVHTEAEVRRAIGAGARIVGINNRDLRTFSVDLQTTLRLRPLIPDDVLVVSESGIGSPVDLARVRQAGVHAVLIGTALMASTDPAATLRALRRV